MRILRNRRIMTMPDERTHISKMLGISDEDAVAVIKDIAAAVATHPRMSDVVGELAAKYGKKAILAGMLLDKTFDANERVRDSVLGARPAESKKRACHDANGDGDFDGKFVDDGESGYGEVVE